MAIITVEKKIEQQFNCTVRDLFDDLARKGFTSKQAANKLGYRVSNVRRIAKKYKIRFNQFTPQENIRNCSIFLEKKINVRNFLSRAWRIQKNN